MSTTNEDSDRKKSFLDSYDIADTAEKCLRQQFAETELVPTSYGIDRRHEQLSAEDIDGRPDLKLSTPDVDLCGFLEVKSKNNASWMFVCNQYQWDKYVTHAQTYCEPTYIVWTLLDDDDGIEDAQFVRVEDWDQVERVFNAPDGHTVVKVSDESAVGFDTFVAQISE